MKILYRTKATASGGRDGSVATADGSFQAKLGMPKELGGNGIGNNPEQLFASGYAACFLSALKFVAGKAGVKVPADATVAAEVGLGDTGAGFALDVGLTVALPGLAKVDAEALVAKAHQVCPYSNATRNNIAVRLSVA